MPAGKTHEKINGIALPVLLVLFFISGGWTAFVLDGKTGIICLFLFFCGYWFGTYFFGPDLDTKSGPYYRWGRLRFLWIWYQKMCPHRSFWSHGLLIGDVIRTLYIGVPIVLLWGLLEWVLPFSLTKWVISTEESFRYAWSFWVGIVLASTLHIVADVVVTRYKKRWIRRR